MAKGEGAAIQKGIIYHYYCLKKMTPQLDGVGINAKYEIDHIYAQAQFGTAATINKGLMESLGNKALLPKSENISKSDKPINQLKSETWLFDMVKKYSGITDDEVDKFSDITNIQELIDKRIKDYRKVFFDDRILLFNSAHI